MIKKIIPKIKSLSRPLIAYAKRKSKKIIRIISKNKSYKNSYTFVITCVKRVEYAKLIIKNINSLHCINPTHKFIIYCDKKCHENLQKNKNKFDYPKQTTFENIYGQGEKPWQYYKIKSFIKAANNDYILTHADEIWHSDPVVDKEKITFLVSPRAIHERPNEKAIVENTFKKPEWTKFKYYSTGFVSVPKKFMSKKIAEDCKKFCNILLEENYDFIKNKKEKKGIIRLSEQMAINLAIQKYHPAKMIITLKEIDGPKNTNILQSTYYGCANSILK